MVLELEPFHFGWPGDGLTVEVSGECIVLFPVCPGVIILIWWGQLGMNHFLSGGR